MKLNQQTFEAFKERICSVTPDSAPRWGTLTPAKVLRHLRAHLDVSIGRDSVPDESTFMSRTVVKWLTFHVMTRWPKGLPAPAEFFPEPLESFQEERKALLESMERFVQLAATDPDREVLSRAFGKAPLRYWERMHGLHMEHHLRQLGV